MEIRSSIGFRNQDEQRELKPTSSLLLNSNLAFEKVAGARRQPNEFDLNAKPIYKQIKLAKGPL